MGGVGILSGKTQFVFIVHSLLNSIRTRLTKFKLVA